MCTNKRAKKSFHPDILSILGIVGTVYVNVTLSLLNAGKEQIDNSNDDEKQQQQNVHAGNGTHLQSPLIVVAATDQAIFLDHRTLCT